MILLLHIAVALSSIAQTTILLIAPSKRKLITSYILIAATLGSGIYLTVVDPAQMLRTCVAGLAYASVVSAGVMIAQSKLRRMSTFTRSLSDEQ